MSESLNQEFSKRIVINTLEEKWHKSPSGGVDRIYLERDNMGEFSIASSLVKFSPDSSFDEHIHDNGEEIYVLTVHFLISLVITNRVLILGIQINQFIGHSAKRDVSFL